MYVLLDTNIYDEDILLKRPEIKAMSSYINRVHTALLIPVVTKLEIEKHLKERAIIDFSKLKSSLAAQTGLMDDSITAEIIAEKLLDNFEKKLRHTPKVSLGASHVQMSEILERSLAEKPPFRKSDKGLRDTILWLTLLKYLTDHQHYKIAIISSDMGDFGGKEGGLKKELADEARELNVLDRIHYFNNLGDFLTQHANPIAFIDEDFIYRAIESSVENQVDDYDEDSLDIDVSLNSQYEVEGVDYEDFEIDNYYIYDETETEYIVYVDVYVSYNVQLTVFSTDYSYNPVTDSYDLGPQRERESTSGSDVLEFFVRINKSTCNVVEVETDYVPENLPLQLSLE